MSSPRSRIARIARLAGIIQVKLDHEVAALSAAQQREQAALVHHEQSLRTLAEAHRSAQAKLATGVAAEQWRIQHAWIETLSVAVRDAVSHLEQRRKAVEQARTRVLAARDDLHRIEALLKRMRATQRAEDTRLERKAEDDAYAALAALPSRSRDS